jgi:hypothetical protein
VSKDIARILEGWDFEPGTVQVRLVTGEDGTEKLQFRLDLGLLQLELAGRPDGTRPFGHESLLEMHEALAREAEARAEGPYRLDDEALSELLREGIQYYHRYLALYQLRRYDLVARDTERNLRMFAFVAAHVDTPEQALAFDQYRPYVTMMHTRALAGIALDAGQTRAAIEKIDVGIEAILAFLREYQREDRPERCPELAFLRNWRAELDRTRDRGPIEKLELQLDLAVTREDYEEAARLRDQIRRLRSAFTGEVAEETPPA